MNRLSPLIVRRVGRFAPAAALDWPQLASDEQSKLLDDVQLFITGWLGGLVFFGTLLA